MGKPLSAFYGDVVAPRLAKLLRDCIREVCGIQAPTKMSGGRIVAATPAVVGAPPRRVTGNLWTSVQARKNKVYIIARSEGGFDYPDWLESHDHPFIALAKKKLMERTKSSRARVTEADAKSESN